MKPVVRWAPGRVNLIGEHIDYCGGTVLPMPIQYGTRVTVQPRDDQRVVARSDSQSQSVGFALSEECYYPSGHWGAYVYGAIRMLEQHGRVAGVDIDVSGDIPGSGLSSSASLCVALIGAVADAHHIDLDRLAIAKLARRVECDFVGVNCGLMDQAAVTLGQPDAALAFDCARERWQRVDMTGAGIPSIVVVDTNRPRQLSDTAYNTRLAEVVRAASVLDVDANQLAQASIATLDAAIGRLDSTAWRRARHVITENERVASVIGRMRTQSWEAVGELFDASHASLRDDYEVSCAELEYLIAALLEIPAVLGARLTGAGFGGCVVALLQTGEDTRVLAPALTTYQDQTGLEPRAFVARSKGGLQRG